MLRYPAKALRAIVYLFKPYNDIDVYVEDVTCRNMYEVLITRMLNKKLKIKKIFQVGSKRQVIEACAKDQIKSARKRMYIVDGDFDVFFGYETKGLKHLYELKVYSSENLLLTETAILEVAYECITNAEREMIRKKIKFAQYINSMIEILRPLIAIYCIAYLLRSNIETVGFNVTQLLLPMRKNKPVKISKLKVKQRIKMIRDELEITHKSGDIDKKVTQVRRTISKLGNESTLISGKTYLLPIIYHHLQRNASYSGNLDQLRVRLARYCDLDVDPSLRKALNKL